jgi:hypothetical protein
LVSRRTKPTPYAVCYGCNRSVQTDVHEVNRDTVTGTWHAECYEAEHGNGEGEDDAEGFTAVVVEEH